MSNVYQISYLPDFKGELTRSAIDPKNRASIQSDALEVIARRNRFYLMHAIRSGVPFQYERNIIYLDDKVVAALTQVADTEEGKKEKDLVRLVEPNIVMDISNINSELHSIITELRGKKFLIAYSFFDWLLYLRGKVGDFSETQMVEWSIKNNYLTIEIDDAGRINVGSFKDQTGLTDTMARRGFRGALIIGNPEYLESDFLYQGPGQGTSHQSFRRTDITNRRDAPNQPELFGPSVFRLSSRLHPRGSVHQRSSGY